MLDVVEFVFSARLASETNHFGICVSCEAAGIVEDSFDSLPRFDFIIHRALHIAVDAYELLIWRHDNHVAFLEAYVSGGLAVEEVFIDVDSCNFLSVAQHLDVTERTYVVDASGTI